MVTWIAVRYRLSVRYADGSVLPARPKLVNITILKQLTPVVRVVKYPDAGEPARPAT